MASEKDSADKKNHSESTGAENASGTGSEPAASSSGSEPAASPAPNRQLPHLDDLYREVVIDHYRHPRGRKELPDANVSAEGYNPSCGDQARVALAVEGDRVKDVHVDCHGCSISVASGSMMAELLVGRSREEIDQLAESFKAVMHGREPAPGVDMGDLEALEGVQQFPVRIKCALLAWTTLQEALAAFASKKDEPPAGGNDDRPDVNQESSENVK